MVIKSIIHSLLKRIDDSFKSLETKEPEIKLTEDDILKAIDDLEGNYKVEKPKDELLDKANFIQIKSPKIWSLFKYIYKPDMLGLEDIKEDDRVYFTLPSGWGENQATLDIEYYYLTFAAGDTTEDITEFMTKTKIEDTMYLNN